jgi:hypothetical protein
VGDLSVDDLNYPFPGCDARRLASDALFGDLAG